MRSKKSYYEFNIDDNNLINAIALYNQKIEIKRIKEDGKTCEISPDEPKTGADLLSIVKNAIEKGRKTIKITYRHTASETLYGVFPKFSPLPNSHYKNTPAQKALLSHFLEIYSKSTGEEGIRTSKLPQLLPLTQDEAINFICTQDDADISGILHLAHHNTLLFEMNSYCCCLIYGVEPELNIVKKLSLDIQNGFSFGFYSPSYDFASDLHDYFTAWQSRNYQGSLFPDNLSVNFKAAMKEKDDGLREMGIEAGSHEYEINDSISLIFKGDEKLGPRLTVKINGLKKALYITKQNAYDLMAICNNYPIRLSKIIKYMKDKNKESWNELAKFIEINSVISKQKEPKTKPGISSSAPTIAEPPKNQLQLKSKTTTQKFKLDRPELPLQDEQLEELIKNGLINEIASNEDEFYAMLGLPKPSNSNAIPRFSVDETVIKDLLLKGKFNPEPTSDITTYCRQSRNFVNEFSNKINVTRSGFYIKFLQHYLITEVGIYFESKDVQALLKDLQDEQVINSIHNMNKVEQVVIVPIFTTSWGKNQDHYDVSYNDMKKFNQWLNQHFEHQNTNYVMKSMKEKFIQETHTQSYIENILNLTELDKAIDSVFSVSLNPEKQVANVNQDIYSNALK